MKSLHKHRSEWLRYFAERDVNPRSVLKVFRPEYTPQKMRSMMSLFVGKMIFTKDDLTDWKNIKSAMERTNQRNNGKIFS